ncbi:hypothetical protein DFJ43DRAFT_1159295 [Lentinula guzmanii]|uniref:Protein SMG7 n=1 Tax=Lentinula guzmanii TaxID=2804957 RepID=A0AA38JB07_9AGAR|nr:hypothetical protein DFJ43DRAFT_1159295 [Lentinula guzmanii]
MSDQPSTILREAKGTHASIKELLKIKEPFDRDIDFQRKILRRHFLNLLLIHPYAKESKNAETHLWMQTSYTFISEYKQHLTRIERANQRSTQAQQSSTLSRPVEYRKLLQRFRQYLAEEYKFWTQFVVRYYRSFELTEAHDALVTLGILSETADTAESIPSNNGRNHFQFPTATLSPPTTSADRESRLTILSKALVCLGDIARYREQYNEAGGRSRVGNGGPIANVPRPKNFEKARTCYEQAKFLTPHDGKPSHQLAIIASHEHDIFTSLVHYYRSLCVKHPYETASENMAGLLSRALEQWKAGGRINISPDLAHIPKMRIEDFKRKVVVLHALWWLGDESHASLMIKKAGNIFEQFYNLVAERHLPEDFITQLVILAQGALWRIRMHQDPSIKSNHKLKLRSGSPSFSPVVEARIFTHLLSLYRALFEVGIENLKEPPPVEPNLASRLIVEFRRTLPATRLVGKWLIANYKYVMNDPEARCLPEKGNTRDFSPLIISPSSVETIDFWRKYANFLRALSRAFPADQLPQLTFALPEDMETRGFRPLKDYVRFERGTHASDANVPRRESEVHPNDVQLMRIEDILCDAKTLVQMKNSPLAIYGNKFVLKGVESQFPPIPPINPDDDPIIEDPDDDLLREIFDHSNKEDADGDEHENEDEVEDEADHIVWNPKPRYSLSSLRCANALMNDCFSSDALLDTSPVLAKLVADVHPVPPNAVATSVITIAPPTLSAKPATPPVHTTVSSNSSSFQDKPSRVDTTTAADLLQSLMSSGRTLATRTTSDPLVPHTPFLSYGNNIWPTFTHEQLLRYPASVHPLTPQPRHHTLSASQDISSQQSIWTHNPDPQNHANTLSSSTFAAHSAYPDIADPGHQRALSASSNMCLHPSNLPRNYTSGPMTSALPASYLPQYPSLDTAENSYPHPRHLPFHDTTTYSSQAMRFLPSIWGPNG